MASRERGRRSTAFRTVAVLTILPILGLVIFYGWNWVNGGERPEETWQEFKAVGIQSPPPAVSPTVTAPPAAVPPADEPLRPSAPSPRDAEPDLQRTGDIVLIIDDLGFEGQPIERVMALDPNVNCSVLPNANGARRIASLLHERGFEVLCHLPMQPRGNESPGVGAILTPMGEDEIAELTRRNIAAVPNAQGVNNHMGSLATSDRRVMASVLGALPSGLYFVDSRTTGNSVAESVSRELKIPTAARDVFLDDLNTPVAVRRQLLELARLAGERGVAIGIGHPRDVTLDVLEEELPKLKAKGFRFVRASSVVR